MRGHTIVIDIGKTRSKASLWSADGRRLAYRARRNLSIQGPGYRALDAQGIESWLVKALAELGTLAPVARVIPVAHGAAMALLRDGKLLLPPMDYEQPIPADVNEQYNSERDPFALTGSPELPAGLNLGAQLHWLQVLSPQAFSDGTTLVPWSQYWAWRLCGQVASEVTSLGCHTDLWFPEHGGPSMLAQRRGWAEMLAPRRHASDCLGTLSAEWSRRTGLPRQTEVFCGLHDSNAALLAARGIAQVAGRDSTVLSTGTWFIALRSPVARFDLAQLPVGRDCLVNVDVDGAPVPSARFMGGREIETLVGTDHQVIDRPEWQARLLATVSKVLACGLRVRPTLVAGCGPYPNQSGGWLQEPIDPLQSAVAAALYAALVADVSLELIGSQGLLLIEGRFAASRVFARALATLRPDMECLTADAGLDVSFGALRLIDAKLTPEKSLRRVEPLPIDLAQLRAQWRADAECLVHELGDRTT